MRIGIISDIHGNMPALKAVLDDLENNADEILCAGDLIGYYPFPNEVIQMLEENNVRGVKGNHDAKLIGELDEKFNLDAERALSWTGRNIEEENTEFLRRLPTSIRTELDSLDIYLTHGSPQNNLTEYISKNLVNEEFISSSFDREPDVVILGHTHKPFAQRVKETLVLNPGSVGQPRDGNPEASYILLDTDTNEAQIRRISYNIDEVADKTSQELTRSLAERLYIGE